MNFNNLAKSANSLVPLNAFTPFPTAPTTGIASNPPKMMFAVRSSWLNFRCVPQSSPSIPLFICTPPYTTAAAAPSGGQRIVVMMIPTPIPMSRTISSFFCSSSIDLYSNPRVDGTTFLYSS